MAIIRVFVATAYKSEGALRSSDASAREAGQLIYMLSCYIEFAGAVGSSRCHYAIFIICSRLLLYCPQPQAGLWRLAL